MIQKDYNFHHMEFELFFFLSHVFCNIMNDSEGKRWNPPGVDLGTTDCISDSVKCVEAMVGGLVVSWRVAGCRGTSHHWP